MTLMVVLPADRYTRYTSRYTSINIQVGNSAAALEDFDAGIKAGYALAYIGAARVHLVAGNAAEALASLRLVDELRPTDSVVYTLRSEAYDAMGDVEAAAEQRTLAEMLTEGKECCVCMEAVRNTRLHPCMHSALCAACAEGMRARGSKCVARRPPQFVSSFVCPESPPAEVRGGALCQVPHLLFDVRAHRERCARQVRCRHVHAHALRRCQRRPPSGCGHGSCTADRWAGTDVAWRRN